MSESRIDRIKTMENILDEANQAINEAPDKLFCLKEKIEQLEAYYTDGQWLKDYEYDENGKLPSDLKRGVLSEDAISDDSLGLAMTYKDF